MTGTLIEPYGGPLVDLLAPPPRLPEIREASRTWPSWSLSPRQTADLELLLSGAYSPLRGFMTRAAAESVRDAGRLPDGRLWPVPVVLRVGAGLAGPGATVALRDAEGVMLAALHVEEAWEDAGTCLAGRLEGLQLPIHYDFAEARETPAATRRALAAAGWTHAVSYQGRGPLHRADVAALESSCRERGARLLLQPAVGSRGPGDPDHYCRVRCLRAARAAFPAGFVRLALLPLAPEEGEPHALLRAIVARNSGCDHLLLDPTLEAAAGTLERHRSETGVAPVALGTSPALPERELLRMLEEGRPLPEGYTFPDVERELRHLHPPPARRGFTVFFTGLSGSGKSTVANALLARLLERGDRYVTLLDGDLVRKHLSSELGFSREHRDLNIRRIGFVAAEITKHGGVAICSPIAPYENLRREVREMIQAVGGFVLVHLSTPLEVCEQRDRKGLYAKARSGLLKAFTGISDPYEPPERAEVAIDTSFVRPEEAAGRILGHLEERGFLGTGRPGGG